MMLKPAHPSDVDVPEKAGARLELENLRVGFKGQVILSNITLTVKPGELLALAGPNGGGKTTLLKTIGGLLKPLAGRVLLDGKDIQGMGKQEKAGNISVLFQGATPDWPFTVQEVVSQGRSPYRSIFAAETALDKDATDRALITAGLSGFENRRITELSGGEFQRVLIARAMAQEARLLLLDEPANNLDPKYQYMVMNLVRSLTKRGLGALVSLHDLSLASLYADRIALIHQGSIVALGKPDTVLQEAMLAQVFGIPLVISPHAQDPRIPAVAFPLPE
ncbi:MAG: ABC transporter ATP-binding protein [Treponema sp.]|jgi:iron complex transport system ATP-binding protein|nr:ABC transporter ATP-binding protein [Treponema sp.]